jgi:hypothetical protein
MGLVDEAGDGDFIRADYAQFIDHQVSTSGNSVSASGDSYADTNKTFPDGSTHGTWNMNGTIEGRHTISATTAFRTDHGTSAQGTFALTFDPLYTRPSSLATVSGSFAPTHLYSTLVIGVNGAVQESAQICSTGGQISIINPVYNLYRVQLTTTCDNGVVQHESGLAMPDNTVSPERLVVGLIGDFAYADTWVRCCS